MADISRRDFFRVSGLTLGSLAFRKYDSKETPDYGNFSKVFNDETINNSTQQLNYKDAFSFNTTFVLEEGTERLGSALGIDPKKLLDSQVEWIVETENLDTQITESISWDKIDQNNLPKSEIASIKTPDEEFYFIYSAPNGKVVYTSLEKILGDKYEHENIVSCSVLKDGCIQIFTETKDLIAVYDEVDNFKIEYSLNPYQIDPYENRDPWNPPYDVAYKEGLLKLFVMNDLSIMKCKTGKSNIELESLSLSNFRHYKLDNIDTRIIEQGKPFFFKSEDLIGYFNESLNKDENNRKSLSFMIIKGEQKNELRLTPDISTVHKFLGVPTNFIHRYSNNDNIMEMAKTMNVKGLPLGIITVTTRGGKLPWISISIGNNGVVKLQENHDAAKMIYDRSESDLPKFDIFSFPENT